MTKKKNLPPKVKCPECAAEYPSAKGLSSHRRAVHGYVSVTSSALSQRRKRELAKAGEIPLQPFQCDKCEFIATSGSGLNWHRAIAHVTNAELKCDVCPFIAKWPGGLTYHKRTAHKEAHPTPVEASERKIKRREIEHTPKATLATFDATSNGHHPTQEAHSVAASDPIPEAALAIGLGRFQELSRSIAFEHDLPPRMFAARLAGLIYAATVR